MYDPHVVSLRYRLVTANDLVLDDPQRANWTHEEFDISADDGEIVIQLNRHFARIDEAKRSVEGFLRAWEIDQGLFYGRERIWFEYVDAEIIDRNPPGPGDPQTIEAITLGPLFRLHPASISQTLPAYPDPPTDLIVTPETELLWSRYLAWRSGKEPLASMAYFCLTFVELMAGGRDAASRRLGISKPVLNTLGRLTSEVGDELTARKAPRPAQVFRPLSKREERWVDQVLRVLIRRSFWLVNVEGTEPTQVTMADFISLRTENA